MTPPQTHTDHVANARQALDQADRIANSDSHAWDGGPGRHVHVANFLATAQAEATLALVAEIRAIRTQGLAVADMNAV